MRRALAVIAVLLVVSSQAFAWSDAGHKIIASIAFSRLTLPERETVVSILMAHPRYKVDFLDSMPADVSSDDSPRYEMAVSAGRSMARHCSWFQG